MKHFYLLIVFSISFLSASTVDTSGVFSASIKQNFKKYEKLAADAFENKNYQKAEVLFDSLVHNSFIGTTFDDFSFKRMGKSRIQLSEIKKPILLLTYASWCVMDKGEIPAVNQLAKEYKKNLQIVVVFWDKEEDMKKIGNEFSSDVMVCYAHETEQKDLKSISLLKRTFGFPTVYMLDENLEVMNIEKSWAKAQSNKIDVKTATEVMFQKYNTGLATLIETKEFNNSGYAAN